MKSEQRPATIFSVGGGKGGVGKSVLSIALAVVLARQGKSVILADLDLGAANLHTYLGIRGRIPSIADFMVNKVPSLSSILVETPVPNLALVSGAEFVPGITNPAHWMKMKLIRHLRALPAEYLIIDLGAGVHFNTLDFFCLSDRGIVITTPEPGSVMNAYSFVKGALFRKIQGVFKHHPDLAPLIKDATNDPQDDPQFTLEWLSAKIGEIAPDLRMIMDEIDQSFRPALVINRAPAGRTHVLVQNLISLCREKLGVRIDHVGDLPETRALSNHLLNVPQFLDRREGKDYASSVQWIVDRLVSAGEARQALPDGAFFADEDIKTLISLMDSLDERVFEGRNRNAWKLRLFFRPADVVSFLVSRGVSHDLFHKHQ
ncbi:MAG: P-loop NTPase [Smithellaceae bacterium]|nr:P-loop NTPase [Smithellaceae bacterium]